MKINSLLNRYISYQAVTLQTHELCHTLDIVMFGPTDNIVCYTTVTQFSSSDYFCVVCDLSSIKHVNQAEPRQ